MTSLYRTATEYTANEVTLTRGTASDIVSVGVAMISDPGTVPAPETFTDAIFVDGIGNPGDPLADGRLDIVAKIGPGGGAVSPGHFPSLTPGDYQRWVKVVTADEIILRRPDVVTIL